MWYKKRNILKFFSLQLCLVIPVVMVSIFIANLVTREMEMVERHTARYQLNEMLTGFISDCQDYYEEGVLLATRPELRKDRISSDPVETADGISTLKMKQYFDSRVANVFLYYGTKYIYSSSGVSSCRVHFNSVLNCREESVSRGMKAVESDRNTLTFLFQTDTSGYLLYSYPVRHSEEEYVSVNFAIPFERLKRQFDQLQEGQIYLLETSDGSTLRLGRDNTGEMVVFSEKEWNEITGRGSYIELSETLDSFGIVAKLYYKERFFDFNNGFRRMQMTNICLIIGGILLSAVVSWNLSRKRVSEIVNLESVAKGDISQRLPDKSVYNQLQNIITSKLSESRELETRLDKYTSLLRDREAQFIFWGLSKNVSDIELAFQELGFDGYPRTYFVGALCAKKRLEEPLLPSELKECLTLHVIRNSKDVLFFLYELHSTDSNQIQRKDIAVRMRNNLHGQGIGQIYIGMSQVYTDPVMIDCAYSEASSVLDYVISGEIKDFCGCWENAVQNISFLLPDQRELQKFTEALQDQDYEEAKKRFTTILHRCSRKECTEENRIFIRHMLLQCLVEYLKEENTVEKRRFLEECLNIDVKDEKEYLRSMNNMIKRCTDHREVDNFSKMLDYIENNYCRSDLVYDEVAAVGGIGKTYVSKIFRAKLGMSYIEYLTAVRMDRACTLLRTTDISVNDIASMVGYENASSFRRCFKDKYGMSAVEYRKRERALQEELEKEK